jgi:DNA-binding transcriptional LysR family regulator
VDLQSLQDLLALIEVRNVTLAARRRNISQPAFSRRLQAIEGYFGVDLVDRSVRPARPTAALDAMCGDIERAIADLRRLKLNISHSARSTQLIAIAAVHALAGGVLPSALGELDVGLAGHTIHLRAGNQDACINMLLTEQVSVAYAYETDFHRLSVPLERVEKFTIASDAFLPVCSPSLAPQIHGSLATRYPLPLLAYPSDLFLGRVLFDEILPRADQLFTERLVTAFTNSLQEAAREGLGVGWLPRSLIRRSLKTGDLVLIDEKSLPRVDLDIVMLQLRTRNSEVMTRLWTSLAQHTRRLITGTCVP